MEVVKAAKSGFLDQFRKADILGYHLSSQEWNLKKKLETNNLIFIKLRKKVPLAKPILTVLICLGFMSFKSKCFKSILAVVRNIVKKCGFWKKKKLGTIQVIVWRFICFAAFLSKTVCVECFKSIFTCLFWPFYFLLIFLIRPTFYIYIFFFHWKTQILVPKHL